MVRKKEACSFGPRGSMVRGSGVRSGRVGGGSAVGADQRGNKLA